MNSKYIAIVIVLGIVVMLIISFCYMSFEFNRVAKDEMQTMTWLSEKAALIDTEGQDKHITTVILANKKIADDDLKHLLNLSRLKKLDLSGTQITDTGIKHLCSLSSLEELHLSHTDITDAALAQLTCLQNLEYFDISYTKVTQKGIEVLERCPKLKILAIDGIGEK